MQAETTNWFMAIANEEFLKHLETIDPERSKAIAMFLSGVKQPSMMVAKVRKGGGGVEEVKFLHRQEDIDRYGNEVPRDVRKMMRLMLERRG
jgi:hypothetical protein